MEKNKMILLIKIIINIGKVIRNNRIIIIKNINIQKVNRIIIINN